LGLWSLQFDRQESRPKTKVQSPNQIQDLKSEVTE
jgi:hypothetical protein